MSADPVEPERPPERIGRYLVFRAFARGGMASVHLGRLRSPEGFSRIVAIKRLHPMFADSPAHSKMLIDEARLSSRVRHANVAAILDVVREKGELCLVMEYVHGVSLAELLHAAQGSASPVPRNIAVAIVTDMLRGLHAAHEARGEDGSPLGIVHRDVSPQNVLVGADGVARVVDFGIAKAVHHEQMTMSGEVKGKLAYMSPEQLRGAPLTCQSDVFAAGVVLWELLANARLFGGDDIADVARRIQTEVPGPPTARGGPAAPALDAVARRALSAAARDRFDSAEQMAVALALALAPAAPEDVSQYLSYASGDELDLRAEAVRNAEGYVEAPEGPAGAERAESGSTAAASGGRPRRLWSTVGLAISVAAIAGLAVATFRRPASAEGPDPRATLAAPSMPSAAATTLSDPGAASSTTGPASAVSGGLVAEATRPARLLPPPAPARSAPNLSPAPSGSAAPEVSSASAACRPPYRIDADGHKHYKAECYP